MLGSVCEWCFGRFMYQYQELTPLLAPLLAGLSQLIRWLRQWHNDLDPALGVRLGDYFLSYLEDELRRLGRTAADLRVLGYGS